MTRVLLRLSGISARSGAASLISGVSLSIPEGGIHVILGANGAGKSSLLRTIHGLTTPSAGTIEWSSPTLRQAMVFQKAVFLRSTVQHNLDIAMPADATRQTQHAIRDVLDRVGLTGKAQQAALTLSGGEQQKLALARALLRQPDLLLLDEPTANLDIQAAPEFESLLLDVAQQGCTVLMTSHSLRQARRIASSIIFMHEGCVLEHEPAQAFFEGPATPQAQWFLTVSD